jgi:hypothetical protein
MANKDSSPFFHNAPSPVYRALPEKGVPSIGKTAKIIPKHEKDKFIK